MIGVRMSITLNVGRDEPLEGDAYRAALKSAEEKETTFGERLVWLFVVLEHNAEVAGSLTLG
jgi:hypothetical protein